MLWGLTPALDLQSELEENSVLNEEINILLIGGADCRHVLKTLAKRYRHKNTKINFYLMEACPETIAKQLLLLYVALQSERHLGLVQKTRYFMELYGNMIIRPAVAKYLTSRAAYFIDMITDYERLNKIMPFLAIDVKYKERDYIENLFKFWCGADVFDIRECWDRRLRKSLGARYDNKKGAFDWDLHMRYHHIGGNIIGNQEYQNFRSDGVAFSWLESEVSTPNRSMVCGVIPNGKSFLHYGYMGDMITGPFVAYGLDCKDKEMLKKVNNMHVQRSTDITEWNLREIFHEIQNNCEYVHQKMNELNLGYLVTQLNDMNVVDSNADGDTVKKSVEQCIDLNGIQITFLSFNYLPSFEHKEEFHNFFDMVYFNFNYLKHLDAKVIGKIAKPGCLLYLENQLFVLNFREKELEAYEEQVKSKIEELQCDDIEVDAKKCHYLKFLIKGSMQ